MLEPPAPRAWGGPSEVPVTLTIEEAPHSG